MATKKAEPEIPGVPDNDDILEMPLATSSPRLKSDRRQSLVDAFTAAILSGVKFDLDGKMPNQEQRNKIVGFAVKMADDVIAATN